ncbi:hypothetical protein Avbf_04536 [Armadillidium vulgare]|nr:hypothetical protein Avbf_04536 [Armadillidium vulgare]
MLDFYGTFRGKCKECSCIEYVTENNSIKCAYCDHSPSKHEIKPNRSLNDWKISDLLHALKETFSLRRDLAIMKMKTTILNTCTFHKLY